MCQKKSDIAISACGKDVHSHCSSSTHHAGQVMYQPVCLSHTQAPQNELLQALAPNQDRTGPTHRSHLFQLKPLLGPDNHTPSTTPTMCDTNLPIPTTLGMPPPLVHCWSAYYYTVEAHWPPHGSRHTHASNVTFATHAHDDQNRLHYFPDITMPGTCHDRHAKLARTHHHARIKHAHCPPMHNSPI